MATDGNKERLRDHTGDKPNPSGQHWDTNETLRNRCTLTLPTTARLKLRLAATARSKPPGDTCETLCFPLKQENRKVSNKDQQDNFLRQILFEFIQDV